MAAPVGSRSLVRCHWFDERKIGMTRQPCQLPECRHLLFGEPRARTVTLDLLAHVHEELALPGGRPPFTQDIVDTTAIIGDLDFAQQKPAPQPKKIIAQRGPKASTLAVAIR